MKMNKKLLGSLILGVMLCTPLTGARAADLTEGAIYGNGDNYGTYREPSEDGKTLTYDFDGEESNLKFTTSYPKEHSGAIFINEQNVDDDFNTIKIMIN